MRWLLEMRWLSKSEKLTTKVASISPVWAFTQMKQQPRGKQQRYKWSHQPSSDGLREDKGDKGDKEGKGDKGEVPKHIDPSNLP
jgi:hypothetical protein